MKNFFIISIFTLFFFSFSTKNTELNSFFQTKELKGIVSFENWYWMTICGNEVAFITETVEEAFEQAFDLWYGSCGPGRDKWDILV
ncbi:hypothetical protein I6H88_15150 [Elizabethkingia bruuniana]|uniref:Uncharacterized protein n=1 Tax=Elizabethkingia bruuniana TaxID=1756149 RepID=A0A7T7UWZ2_9FLAO|nr:hypothetical protein [Elizabethkingia bruuniana]AQX84335.1 hypothetical protein AYC65_04555 [Elizabethkingia bruuniana]KUY27789.1 hypothetical protein ATB97_16555 [Elizabethkingia bruuniana]OPB64752.1 hypothetical protein BAY12_08195 [Elizabethkingia bruuniana]QQN57770.1 hypothetical protein I6H88_15150 [Elizabethkingia bruuniana]